MSHKGTYIGLGAITGLSAFGGMIWWLTKDSDPYAGAGDPGAKPDSVFLEKIPTENFAFNNPGNIRKSPTVFNGEVDLSGGDFTSFIDMVHGYRAMIEILRHYYKVGYTTLSKAIPHYAPASDGNKTANYISFVSKQTGIDPDQDLFFAVNGLQVQDIIKAMTRFEQKPSFVINDSNINQGYLLA